MYDTGRRWRDCQRRLVRGGTSSPRDVAGQNNGV